MNTNIFDNDFLDFLKKKSDYYSFWGEEAAPSDENIKKAENLIGKRLPKSYIDFLKKYGGGEIVGDPLFGTFGGDLMNPIYEDIGVRYLMDQKSDALNSRNHVIFYTTDFAEIFYFNYFDIPDNSQEVPIYFMCGDECVKYAENFLEFLVKRISFIASTGSCQTKN